MKSIKYILGLGVVGAVISFALLSILKMTDVINSVEFLNYLSRILSILGVVVLASATIFLIVKILSQAQK